MTIPDGFGQGEGDKNMRQESLDGDRESLNMRVMSSTKRLTVTVTGEFSSEIETMAEESGRSMSEVFRIAFALLKVCHQAKRQGKHFGIVSDPERLEREIVGIL